MFYDVDIIMRMAAFLFGTCLCALHIFSFMAGNHQSHHVTTGCTRNTAIMLRALMKKISGRLVELMILI